MKLNIKAFLSAATLSPFLLNLNPFLSIFPPLFLKI